MLDIILKRFDQPDEVRTFDKGKFEIVRIGGLTIGRATYQPGWRWAFTGWAGHSATSNPFSLRFPAARLPPSKTARRTSSRPVRSSIFRPDLRVMIVGWWGMRPMCLFTSLARKITQPSNSLLSMTGEVELNDPKIVEVYDDLPLWSAMAGQLLLRYLPVAPELR